MEVSIFKHNLELRQYCNGLSFQVVGARYIGEIGRSICALVLLALVETVTANYRHTWRHDKKALNEIPCSRPRSTEECG